MRETISRCNICKSESCDGTEYITDDMHGSYGHHVGVITVCKNTEGVEFREGKLMYKLVCGHGDYTYFNLYKKN